ncbi:Sucrose synthase 2 [Vitis vinifera]|uniref:sucrose synthase n=1 Tax=Vitis vinifera TaxID=29760 RepID=A0A438FNZ6_VITVI|nr:Sucrose synthase 2 [Vitis vinifera]
MFKLVESASFVHGLWVGLQERLIVCNDEHPSHPHLADQCHWGSPWRAVATLDITGDMVVFVGFVEGIWVQIENCLSEVKEWVLADRSKPSWRVVSDKRLMKETLRPLALLGLPDTGGQIAYILDQVRALENEMLLKIQKQGLDVIPKILIVTRLIPDAKGTTRNQRLERISGLMYGHIWKPLQRMYQNEIAAELQGVPDLIIDNYSDGNLVASLLSYKLGITQCNIAHALEKTKYPEFYNHQYIPRDCRKQESCWTV